MPEGDGGFSEVLDRHFEDVYGYVAYRLAGDLHAAADVTQEVFLAAVRGWRDFRREGSALTWLRAIARRKVADHFRGRPAGSRQGLEALQAPQEARDADQARAVLVGRVMKLLTEEHAELLEEKYLEGLTVAEMARRRRTSEKAVESALSRARSAFREKFNRLQTPKENPNEQR